MRNLYRTFFSFCIASLVIAAVSCAQNPVSGQQDFVLMSEQDEIEMGRATHPSILKQYRRLEDPALQAYVQEIGERLAQKSQRSHLIYRFTVLDSTEVNAFALPGGYIYITRGLLAYLDSEAELAAVLGHELGHVTARHSVRQISAAKATGIGLAIGSILVPELRNQGAQDLFNVLGNAWISGYGREHELESDRLGAEYLASSGYDPQAMIKVIGVLKNQEIFEKQLAKEEGREARAYHGVFASHPDNDTRLQEVVAKADALKTSATTRINRDAWLKKLDGLTFGDSAHDGISRANHFYHQDLGFTLSFPAGWRVENLPDRLVARPPANDALLMVNTTDLNERIPPDEFMAKRLKIGQLTQGEPLKITHGELPNINGLEGYTAVATVNTPFGRRPTRFSVVYFKNQAFIFVGSTKDEKVPHRYDGEFLETARSLHGITDQELRLAKALQIKIIKASTDTRYANLARTSSIQHHAEEQLRLLNGDYPNGEPVAGEQIKIVE